MLLVAICVRQFFDAWALIEENHSLIALRKELPDRREVPGW
jgi:hypothetical protein